MVSVVLPTYNEADNVVPLIDAVLDADRRVGEVVVVDDDSPDGTWRLAEARAAGDSRVRLIRRVGEKGLTSAIRRGIGESRLDRVAWMDCDFSHPPALLPDLLDRLDAGCDIAVASRYVAGGADRRNEALHRGLSRIITSAARLALDGSFRDYTSGYVAARRTALKELTFRGDYGEYFISLIYQALRRGLRVEEVPFVNFSRAAGESKTAASPVGFAVRGRKYLTTIARLGLGIAEN